MIRNHVNPNSLRQRIIALAVNEGMFVSMDDYSENSARHCASELGLIFGRIYKVNRRREERGFIITREA